MTQFFPHRMIQRLLLSAEENLPRAAVRWTEHAPLRLSHDAKKKKKVYKVSLPNFQRITNVPWKLRAAQDGSNNGKLVSVGTTVPPGLLPTGCAVSADLQFHVSYGFISCCLLFVMEVWLWLRVCVWRETYTQRAECDACDERWSSAAWWNFISSVVFSVVT